MPDWILAGLALIALNVLFAVAAYRRRARIPHAQHMPPPLPTPPATPEEGNHS